MSQKWQGKELASFPHHMPTNSKLPPNNRTAFWLGSPTLPHAQQELNEIKTQILMLSLLEWLGSPWDAWLLQKLGTWITEKRLLLSHVPEPSSLPHNLSKHSGKHILSEIPWCPFILILPPQAFPFSVFLLCSGVPPLPPHPCLPLSCFLFSTCITSRRDYEESDIPQNADRKPVHLQHIQWCGFCTMDLELPHAPGPLESSPASDGGRLQLGSGPSVPVPDSTLSLATPRWEAARGGWLE